MIWDRFLDEGKTDHVMVVEDLDSEGKFGGTTEAELVAKEEKRRKMKRKLEQIDDEL